MEAVSVYWTYERQIVPEYTPYTLKTEQSSKHTATCIPKGGAGPLWLVRMKVKVLVKQEILVGPLAMEALQICLTCILLDRDPYSYDLER